MKQVPTPSPEAEPLDDPPQARRSRRRWLWLVGALIVLPVVTVLGLNAWAEAKLDRALADLRARGEPTSVAELYAQLEANAPEDEDNLAKVPVLLAMQDSDEGRAAREFLAVERPHRLDLLDKSDLHWGRRSPAKAGSMMRAEEDFDEWHPDNQPAGTPDPEPHWEWVDHPDGPAASIYQMSAFMHEAIRELATETRHRARVFWVWQDVTDEGLWHLEFSRIGPDLGKLGPMAGTLRTIALAALERGDPELAVASVEVQLALARSLSEGGTLLGGFTAVVAADLADSVLYDGLRRQAWDEQRLLRLQSALELTFPTIDSARFLPMERIFGMVALRALMRQRAGFLEEMPLFHPTPLQALMLKIMPDGGFHLATVSLLEDYENDFLRSGALLPTEQPQAERRRPEWFSWLDDLNPLHELASHAGHHYPLAIRSRAAATRMRLAHAAVALELFHLHHGRYPDTWQEMISEELAEVPLDPFTGGELRLLPVDESAGRARPVIYPLGLNRADDGGTQAFDTLHGDPSDRDANGDVVWAYPEGED